jgi:hypothetical protein
LDDVPDDVSFYDPQEGKSMVMSGIAMSHFLGTTTFLFFNPLYMLKPPQNNGFNVSVK